MDEQNEEKHYRYKKVSYSTNVIDGQTVPKRRRDRHMADKKCPICGLWSTGSALLCDCGYNFESGTRGSKREDQKSIAQELWDWVGLILDIVGALLFK